MPMVPLDRHCARLSDAFLDVANWVDVCDWLKLGAAIERVEINTAKHDSAADLCHDYGYDEAREMLLRQFVEDLAVFGMVWAGLEAALDIMKLPAHPDRSLRGKVAEASFRLGLQFADRAQCLGLQEEVQAFMAAAERCLGFDRVGTRYALGRALGEAGIGLYVVYELRNQFAHGRLALPHPDEENLPISPYQTLVRHATRIVLLQMQMLLVCHAQHSDAEVAFYWCGEDAISLSTAILELHLDSKDASDRPRWPA